MMGNFKCANQITGLFTYPNLYSSKLRKKWLFILTGNYMYISTYNNGSQNYFWGIALNNCLLCNLKTRLRDQLCKCKLVLCCRPHFRIPENWKNNYYKFIHTLALPRPNFNNQQSMIHDVHFNLFMSSRSLWRSIHTYIHTYIPINPNRLAWGADWPFYQLCKLILNLEASKNYILHQGSLITCRSVSELAVISHEAGRHFILNFMIKQGKNSFLVMRHGVVSLFIWCNPYER